MSAEPLTAAVLHDALARFEERIRVLEERLPR